MPTFRYEKAILKNFPAAVVAGVDEAGRGPLAGPVVAAAVILDARRVPKALRTGLDDSKKLSRERREELYAMLCGCGAAVIGVGRAGVVEIDSINILNATFRAMERATENVSTALGTLVTHALVDGNRPPKLACDVQCIVEGDGKSLSIAAASIVAKVTRDRVMTALADMHPGYGWHTNMGYGTQEHYDGLIRQGVTEHHRRSFAPIRACIAGEPLKQMELLAAIDEREAEVA